METTHSLEKTIVFIEPEIIRLKKIVEEKFIEKRLSRLGRIIFAGNVELKTDMIEGLRPDLVGDLFRAEYQRLIGRDVRVLVIEGDSVIRNVRERVGTHADPCECEDCSLRYYFDNYFDRKKRILSRLLANGGICYPKYLTAASTTEEVVRWAKLFFNGSFQRIMNTT